jgi:adenine-specific DNA-methyltransferase
LAVKLLKKDGIIFISIDENEAANLKLLCDQIFGEDNYVVEFNRKVSASPRMDAKHIAIANDKILVYAKNKNFLVVTKKESETYKNKPNVQKDEHFDERGHFILNKLDRGSINYSKTCDYPIITPAGNVIYPGGDYKK